MDTFYYNFKTTTGTLKANLKKESAHFKKENMIPYGNPILNNDHFVQLFIENETKLSDKYLEILVEELSLHPDYGQLVKRAAERFHEYQGSNTNLHHNKKHGGKKWSMKYKKSINCRKPKGFSQKQHCKYGRNKTRKNKN